MRLTYNKFKQVVERSSQKIFNKIAEAISTSDNAALVAMFDDKLILLDEEKENLYLCDFEFADSKLTMFNFENLSLTENDDSYLNEVVEKYFDLDDEEPIDISEMVTGFNLKFKNESKSIITEAKDRKCKKIMESPRIRAIKKVREVRDMFNEDIQNLMEEPFIQHLSQKVEVSKDSVPAALNKVTFKNPYPITVNTDIGGPAKELLTLKDNTNAMDAMKGLALKISDKWKSDAFRKKFENMINKILQTESVELGKNAVLSFLDENKELFLLKEEFFNELIIKTTFMLGEGNADPIIEIFNKIANSKPGRMMKLKFFRENNINDEKLSKINKLYEEEDIELDDEDGSSSANKEPAKEAGNDLDSEEINKIIDIFKKIKKQLEEDSPESEYISGLIAALDGAKVSGIEDSKMKEIIDFLSSAKAPKKEKETTDKEEPENEVDKDKELEL